MFLMRILVCDGVLYFMFLGILCMIGCEKFSERLSLLFCVWVWKLILISVSFFLKFLVMLVIMLFNSVCIVFDIVLVFGWLVIVLYSSLLLLCLMVMVGSMNCVSDFSGFLMLIFVVFSVILIFFGILMGYFVICDILVFLSNDIEDFVIDICGVCFVICYYVFWCWNDCNF